METIFASFATFVKESAVLAQKMTWTDILKVAVFFNLCVLPLIVAIKW